MPEPRHPYRFSPLQEKLTGLVLVILLVILIVNVFFKVTSAYVMIPLIVLTVVVYVASLIAGKMKK